MKKILGIGSALVDILIQIPDEQILEELDLPKGSMTYVKADDIVSIGERLVNEYGSQRASGGSAANTMSGLAQLGIEAGFLSKIGKDEVGEFFKKQMTDTFVKPSLLTTDTPTGRVIAMVTADARENVVHIGKGFACVLKHTRKAILHGVHRGLMEHLEAGQFA